VPFDGNKRGEDALEPTSDPGWLVQERGCGPLRERGVESRFTISNGLLGVRGVPAICREEVRISSPYTYVAGLFDTSTTMPHIPVLVSAPDWVGVTLLVNGEGR
jgi:trehalose/maltose hydrolase-like predicted phosphorylase